MKIMIISDTHGYMGNFLKAYEKEKPIDMLFHLGDFSGDKEAFEEIIGPACAFAVVTGNCDMFSRGVPESRDFGIGKHRIHMEHGYWPPVTESSIRKRAERTGADIMMFGHTHRPELKIIDGITVLNPGSLTAPRQPDGKHTYAIMTVDSEGEAAFQLKSVEKGNEDYSG